MVLYILGSTPAGFLVVFPFVWSAETSTTWIASPGDAHLCLGSTPPNSQHKGPVVIKRVRNIDNPSDEYDARTSETILQCSDIFMFKEQVHGSAHAH